MHEYNDIMLDIETLDTTPSAVVLSIGAVKFNGDGLGEEFYTTIDTKFQYLIGRTESKATLAWWEQQSKEVQAAVFDVQRTEIHQALQSFSGFFDHPNYKVWGNGAVFDNVIVASLLREFNRDLPWKYSNDRCFRTLRALVYDNFPFLKDDQIQPTVAHNALADAKAQAEDLLRLEQRTQIILMVDMASESQKAAFAASGETLPS